MTKPETSWVYGHHEPGVITAMGGQSVAWCHASYFGHWASHGPGVPCPLSTEICGSRRRCCCFVVFCILSVLGLTGMDITVS